MDMVLQMMIYAKNTKVALTYLRKNDYLSIVQVDDIYLQRKTYEVCLQKVTDNILKCSRN